MSRVVRKSKTKERVSAQYGVADFNPADLDVRQTRHSQYSALPPITGGTWRGQLASRQRSESPEFISTTPVAMSTDEAIELSKKIDEEVAQEELNQEELVISTAPEPEDTLPTVAELQTPKTTEEFYEEIKEGLESSGIISFPKLQKALEEKIAQEKAQAKVQAVQGPRAPLATGPESDQLYSITTVPALTYGEGPDFDAILREGDEFLEKTYSLLGMDDKEEERSQSFVVLGREDQEISSSIYENITQELRDIMPNELYLPTANNRKVSNRDPKVWVRQTPFEGNPAIIVKVEEWLKEVGTRDYAVDVQFGVIYATKGNKWERMPISAEVSTEKVTKGTPVMGPIDESVKTPSSKDPVPVAESTRKEGPTYANEPTGRLVTDATPDPESVPRPQLTKTPIFENPKKKLHFEIESDDERNGEQIQKEIREAQEAEEALRIERQRFEEERLELAKQQYEASKEKLVALRLQRKRLEESIAQMSAELTHNSQLSYKERLTRRQNLVNEYHNQIERENQLVEDFLDKTEEQRDVTMETMTTDSALSSTADPIDFLDEAAMMKIKIKHIRAEHCQTRSLAMYRHFIKKARDLGRTKDQEDLENLMLATTKSLERKIVKYKRILDSCDTREQQYFAVIEQKRKDDEAKKMADKKKRAEEEEAELQKKHKETEKQLAEMRKQEALAGQKKEQMEAKVKAEKQKQIKKLEQIADEKKRLQQLQRQRAEQALTEAFLLKEQKQREEAERLLTKAFLAKERQREKEEQEMLTRELLEKERLEKERLEKERVKSKNIKKSQRTPSDLRTEDSKKRTFKPTSSEQEAERQDLLSALNDVVVNGQKPSKEKDLRWDYGKDKKAQAIFGKMRRPIREPIGKCPRCGTLKHEGECPCKRCGKRGHEEDTCPTLSPLQKKKKSRQATSKEPEVCSCCKTKGHKAQECPWNKEEPMEQVETEIEGIYPTICTHCRALDHMVEDCPALKEADIRRRKITCERCGKQGHDVTACLDETELEKQRELKEKIKRKAKELEEIDLKIKKLGATTYAPSPLDRDTNTFPPTKGKTPSKGKDSKKDPKRQRDESPDEPRQPMDTGPGGGPGGGGAGGDPPDDDPDGSDDGDDEGDEDDEDEGEDDREEEDEGDENPEGSELSDFLYDERGRRIDIDEMFEEWQRNRDGRLPVRIIRGPRGHRGAKGKPGKKGPRGIRGPTGDLPSGGLTDSGLASGNITLNTSGLCTVPKYRAAVDYTLTGVEPHGPTRGVWPIAVVAMIANHIWKHLVFKVMHKHTQTLKCRDLNVGTRT